MTGITSLSIEARDAAGTGPARSVRRQGLTPGVMYGAGQEPLKVSIGTKELTKELHDPHHNTKLYDLKLNGKTHRAVLRDIQLDPVTDHPLHVDFLRVDKSSRISVSVPLKFINEDKSPGLKRGGVLNIVFHELQLTCPAESIPEELIIDLAGLELGHSIHLDTLRLDKNIVPTSAMSDQTLATIVAPSGLKSEEESQSAEATEAAEK